MKVSIIIPSIICSIISSVDGQKVNTLHHDQQPWPVTSKGTSTVSSRTSPLLTPSAMADVETYLSSIGFTLQDVCNHGHGHGHGHDHDHTHPMLQERKLTESEEVVESRQDQNGEEEEEITEEEYIENALFATVCVIVAAMAAGLTMGLLSQELLDLRIKEMASSDDKTRKQAKSLVPLIKDHHRLLVTLLLMNALANEALPIFLDKLVPSYMAVILSVTLVLFFGEIIPSAIFTGPSQLSISSKLAPLVRCVLFLLAPIAWPIAKLLDHFLHEEGSLEKYDRGELSALVRLQYEARKTAKRMRKEERTHMSIRESLSTSLSNDLDRPSEMSHRYVGHIDEVNMVEGALQMHTRKVVDVMQPWKKVYAIPSDMILNEMNILDIYTKGHSRIPVYKKGGGEKDERKQICGLFKSRQLAVISAQEQRPLSTIPLAIPFCVTPSMNMVDLLNILQSGGGHMAIVCLKPAIAEDALSNGKTIPPKAYVVGIVTLEDCIEELIQEEIFDEYDKEERITHNRTKWAIKKWKTFVQKKKTMREAAAADESTKLLV